MVISTCSFKLNGPGFSRNSHFRPLKNTFYVKVDAIRWPSGTTAIWAKIDVIVRGSLRYQKNWFRKERSTHARIPRIHVRKVKLGSEGSSLIKTVRAICSIGEFSIPEGFSGSTESKAWDCFWIVHLLSHWWNCYNNLKLGPKNKNQAKIIKKKK